MKKPIIIFGILILATTVGIYFWADNILGKVAKEEEMTQQLAPNIKSLFADRKSLDDYPKVAAEAKWGKNFLVLEERVSNDLNLSYSIDWNKKLETEKNFPGNAVAGLVFINPTFKILGDYENKYGVKVGKATQRGYAIIYFDMQQKAILSIDSIWASPPSDTKSSTESGMGEAPEEALVTETINKKIK